MSTETRRPLRTGDRARATERTDGNPDRTRRPVPTRRRALARRWIALLVVLALLAVGYAVLFTPLLGVRSVEVTGVHNLTVAQVRTAANVPMGSPLLRLSTDTVERNVAGLPGVESVEVSRSFPGTLSIEVVERSAVAVFDAADGLRLVDATGEPLRVVAKPPKGLPELRLPEVAADDPKTRAALQVLTSLPRQLRQFVRAVDANSPGDVRLIFTSGRIAKWGDAANSARKAAVLTVLLTRKGTVFDVASPGAPTVR